MQQVRKRDGRIEELNPDKITRALSKCFEACGISDYTSLEEVKSKVLDKISGNGNPIDVEHIQDFVEQSLIEMDFIEVARRYMRYRDYKFQLRKDNPRNDKEYILEKGKYFPNDLAEFVYYRSYSRWNEKAGRRETWNESVDRLIEYYRKRTDNKLENLYDELREAILTMDVMPSMRGMAMAGPQLDKDAVSLYNCAALNIDSINSLAEIMYLSMCGAGTGVSIESYSCTDKLPRVRPQKKDQVVETHVIEDTTEAWCDALRIGLEHWFGGTDIKFDYSKIRPAGTRLKTKGGFSSGEGPLRNLLDFTRELILRNQGKKLEPIDINDLCCMISYVVFSGGVRRCATIILSDIFDEAMRHAKDGQFWISSPYRAMANISAVYDDKPPVLDFMDEWMALARSGSGERGIFNRQAANKCKPKRRKSYKGWLVNPCFTGNMHILTRDGYKTFEELVDQEVVLINSSGEESVGNIWCSGEKEVIRLDFENEGVSPIECTPDHIFLTVDKEEVCAKNLKGYRILSFAGEAPEVKSISSVGIKKVYDFSEPKSHWGVVEGLVVHNCGEVLLRNKEMCNLTEVVARPEDTKESLLRKARLAAILGTIQASIINFTYLSPEWIQNAEEERLLGCSITGQMDTPLLNVLITDPNNKEALLLLEEMKDTINATNKEVAEILGINPSAASTAVKPSGTVSQLVNSSSGIHVRYSKFYIRRVRISSRDPLFLLARDCGIKYHPEVGETLETANTMVLEFPVKSPEGCLTRHDVSAMQQLEYWLRVKQSYAEHSVSCTIYVENNEWLSVGNWVYNHFDDITGLSFLPKDNNIYPLAPYQEITEEEYEKAMEDYTPIDYYKLFRYEKEDNTGIVKEVACAAGSCEL